MGTRNMKTVTVSLPPQLIVELDRVREREHRTRSEILRDALRRYIAAA
jgi:metal-responsive CopG/Arc/MetJ family transcriptional regulator